jgi:hypothetical protein
MIFITPYVIKNETEAADLTKKKGAAMEQFREQYRIEKKDAGTLPLTMQPTEKPGSAEKKDTSAVTPVPSLTQPAEKQGGAEKKDTNLVAPISPPAQPAERPAADVVVPPAPPAGETPGPAGGGR